MVVIDGLGMASMWLVLTASSDGYNATLSLGMSTATMIRSFVFVS